MTSLIKNIIIIGGLVALAGIGYYLFVIQGNATLNTGGTGGISQAEIETQAFLRQLEDLQAINISTAIFQDQRFRSLQDFSSIVNRVQSGRSNPFAQSSADTNSSR
jgi:hypothetical protein